VLTVILIVVVPVVALTVARRLAGHPLVRFLLDLFASAWLIARGLSWLARWCYRLVWGEVRAWRMSRS
jgi:hypothetical protein